MKSFLDTQKISYEVWVLNQVDGYRLTFRGENFQISNYKTLIDNVPKNPPVCQFGNDNLIMTIS